MIVGLPFGLIWRESSVHSWGLRVLRLIVNISIGWAKLNRITLFLLFLFILILRWGTIASHSIFPRSCAWFLTWGSLLGLWNLCPRSQIVANYARKITRILIWLVWLYLLQWSWARRPLRNCPRSLTSLRLLAALPFFPFWIWISLRRMFILITLSSRLLLLMIKCSSFDRSSAPENLVVQLSYIGHSWSSNICALTHVIGRIVEIKVRISH